MKKLLSSFLLATLLTGAVSCKKDLIGEGPVMNETRMVSSFSAIDLRMNGNVYYMESPTSKIEISAKQSILPMLETTVSGNRLVIRYSNGKTYDADETIRINVYGPSVNSFELNTSGSIYSLSDIQATNVLLRSAGSGNIYLPKVTAGTLEAITSVSGTVNVGSGSAYTEKLTSSASGVIDMTSVNASVATAQTSGSGDIKLTVANNLSAIIKGSGDIYFRGSPTLTTNIAGSGHLIRF